VNRVFRAVLCRVQQYRSDLRCLNVFVRTTVYLAVWQQDQLDMQTTSVDLKR
jgi:hypothetical protein